MSEPKRYEMAEHSGELISVPADAPQREWQLVSIGDYQALRAQVAGLRAALIAITSAYAESDGESNGPGQSPLVTAARKALAEAAG